MYFGNLSVLYIYIRNLRYFFLKMHSSEKDRELKYIYIKILYCLLLQISLYSVFTFTSVASSGYQNYFWFNEVCCLLLPNEIASNILCIDQAIRKITRNQNINDMYLQHKLSAIYLWPLLFTIIIDKVDFDDR